MDKDWFLTLNNGQTITQVRVPDTNLLAVLAIVRYSAVELVQAIFQEHTSRHCIRQNEICLADHQRRFSIAAPIGIATPCSCRHHHRYQSDIMSTQDKDRLSSLHPIHNIC